MDLFSTVEYFLIRYKVVESTSIEATYPKMIKIVVLKYLQFKGREMLKYGNGNEKVYKVKGQKYFLLKRADLI